MKAIKLQNGYCQVGNHFDVETNKTHIMLDGSKTTLCNMLLSVPFRNVAEIEKHEEIGCPECLHIYGKPNSDEWKLMMNAVKQQRPNPVIIPERFAEYMIDHFTNCLPPIICGKDYVLCSEPYDHNSKGEERFIGFYKKVHIYYGIITTVSNFKLLR